MLRQLLVSTGLEHFQEKRRLDMGRKCLASNGLGILGRGIAIALRHKDGRIPVLREALMIWDMIGRSWSRIGIIMRRLMLSQPVALDLMDSMTFLISPNGTEEK
ncbi:hypothetical protein O3G_MSEX008891 [Manduca sexta]|uniref:Uncharacterized protein n=1 Tax=Manduca sexta TaxID=7130 RepID=A0A921ZCF2_MANSE|nr:hypothetical protein O3G_MSEX008891 [Manduca sexta]